MHESETASDRPWRQQFPDDASIFLPDYEVVLLKIPGHVDIPASYYS